MDDRVNYVKLDDGRYLSYIDEGKRESNCIVIFLHGTPGNRLLVHPDNDTIAQSLGIRIITVERPGYGYADPCPHLSLLSFADDLHQLIHQLQVPSSPFLCGMSGGGPFALACAYRIPQHLRGVAVVSSLAPRVSQVDRTGMPFIFRLGYFLCAYAPPIARWILRQDRSSFLAEPHEFIVREMKKYSLADHELIQKRSDILKAFVESHQEIYERDQIDTGSNELRLFSQRWGFDVSDIPTELPVHVWQGEEDRGCVPGMGRYLMEHIPHARGFLEPGYGHLLYFDRWHDILQELTNQEFKRFGGSRSYI
eukprot:gb/GECH01002370.1/.p1 GENE.gb/GECH01002370.1/~~gb/GECH01002370.1/.p1  ORF type:complete len:309 (+),score=56.36 gb/GECH01002370.1/:1-927(+)